MSNFDVKKFEHSEFVSVCLFFLVSQSARLPHPKRHNRVATSNTHVWYVFQSLLSGMLFSTYEQNIVYGYSKAYFGF